MANDPTYGGQFKHWSGGNPFNPDGSFTQKYQDFWGVRGRGGGSTTSFSRPSLAQDPLSNTRMEGSFGPENWASSTPSPPNPQQELMNIMKQWDKNQEMARRTKQINDLAKSIEDRTRSAPNTTKDPRSSFPSYDTIQSILDKLPGWEKQLGMGAGGDTQNTNPSMSGGGVPRVGFQAPTPWQAPAVPEVPPMPPMPGQFQDPGYHGGLILKGSPSTNQERFSKNIVDPKKFKELNELLNGGLVSSLYRKPKSKKEVIG